MKVIAILGPTATGKTAVSVQLAQFLNTEIISADSMQIYKYMDIGTAKPTDEERAGIFHHMIDIVNPWESFSVGEYLDAVKPILRSIFAQAKVPLVVGGTGLYFMALTRGLFDGYSANEKMRNGLLIEELQHPGTLYQRLQEIDPQTALSINPNDIRRIVRALEVCICSNDKISNIRINKTSPLPYKFIKFGLTMQRSKLYEVINQRVNKMIELGLLNEVRQVIKLISQHIDVSKDILSLPSMQAIGYKEFFLYLQGDISFDKAVQLIKQKSRNYAKRQWTWFNKDKDICWIDVSDKDTKTIARQILDTYLV